MSRRAPEDLARPLQLHHLGDHDVWLTADGRWAILPADDLQALVAQRLAAPISHGPALGPILQGPAAEEELPTVVGRVPATDSYWAPTTTGSNARYWMTSTALLVLSAVLLMLALGIRVRRDHPELLEPLGVTAHPEVAPEPAELEPPAAPAMPAATATPAGPPHPVATPAPAAVATPTPAPAATPAPTRRPAPPSAPSAASSIRAGWAIVEQRPESAEQSFRDALSRQPANSEAQYGLGYALLKRGDREGAARHLCRARTGPPEVSREAVGLLRTHDLTCL